MLAIPSLFDDDFLGLDLGDHFMMPVFPQPKTGTAEIKETPTELAIDLKMPGYKTDDVSVKVSKDGVLTVSAQKHCHKEDKKGGRQLSETYSASYARSFQLPENALRDQIQADFEGGHMRVVVPKDAAKEPAQAPEPKKVKVQIE